MGDPVTTTPSDHWYSNREQALATLRELFNQDDDPATDNGTRDEWVGHLEQ